MDSLQLELEREYHDVKTRQLASAQSAAAVG
jgi:hypothetical protein